MLVAVALAVLLGFVSLAVEFGMLLHDARVAQSAADSSALGAASAIATGRPADPVLEGRAIAATYGFSDGESGTTVTFNRPPTSGSYAGNDAALEAIVRQPKTLPLASLFYAGPYAVTGRAVALVAAAGTYCVLALEAAANNAVSGGNGTDVTLSECGLAVNSSSTRAVNLQSGAVVRASRVTIVGGYRLTSGAQLLATDGIQTGAAATADPYTAFTIPAYSGCTYNSYRTPNRRVETLNPGVFCNGMDIRGNAVIALNAGVYIIDRGNLSVGGGATLTGSGVTIILTSSTGGAYGTATFAARSTVSLSAPATGPTAGVVLAQDRLAPTSGTNTLASDRQTLNGAVYFPRQTIAFTGGTPAGQDCLQLIARVIDFGGVSAIASACADRGVMPIGGASIALVE